jgi:TolB-like protein
MYFEDRSEDSKLRFLADGLTESLIDELSAVKQLKVISRNGVAQFKAKTPSPDSIQKALKVGTVVTGTVTQLGDSLRVSVDLNDALTGVQIGKKKTITRARADVFKLQDDLAKEVALSLRSTLGREVESVAGHPARRTRKRGKRSSARNKPWPASTRFCERGRTGRRPTARAVDSELIAVPIDGQQVGGAGGRAGMDPASEGSDARLWRAGADPEMADQVGKLADTAVTLAPTDPDALELRATIRFFRWLYNPGMDVASSSKLLNDAEADYRAALKANPLQASAWNALSYLLIERISIPKQSWRPRAPTSRIRT